MEKSLTVENRISRFKNTGTFSVDANTFKISHLDKVKLKNYNLWKATGAPVDEDGSPVLTVENESERQLWLTPQMLTALSCTLPLFHLLRMLHQHKEKSLAKNCHFQHSFYSETLSGSSLCATPAQENKGQSCSTQPLCNRPMSQENILNLLEQNAPPGFKYCLTLVPREMDSSKKVLKNWMLTKNANKETQDFDAWSNNYQLRLSNTNC